MHAKISNTHDQYCYLPRQLPLCQKVLNPHGKEPVRHDAFDVNRETTLRKLSTEPSSQLAS